MKGLFSFGLILKYSLEEKIEEPLKFKEIVKIEDYEPEFLRDSFNTKI